MGTPTNDSVLSLFLYISCTRTADILMEHNCGCVHVLSRVQLKGIRGEYIIIIRIAYEEKKILLVKSIHCDTIKSEVSSRIEHYNIGILWLCVILD